MRKRGRQRQHVNGMALLWISGLFSIGGYALGFGARYWRV
jgi:hypothetical protein